MDSPQYNWRLKDALTYGGILGFTLVRGGQLELIFNGQNTDLTRQPRAGGTRVTAADAGTYMMHVGGLYQIETLGAAKPFFSISAGATAFSVGEILDREDLGDPSTQWRGSMHIGGGAKLFPGDNVGIRLQTRLWINFVNASGGFWCGTGGCGIGAGGDVVVRWEFLGGIALGFGNR
jgi:hypothetical protein